MYKDKDFSKRTPVLSVSYIVVWESIESIAGCSHDSIANITSSLTSLTMAENSALLFTMPWQFTFSIRRFCFLSGDLFAHCFNSPWHLQAFCLFMSDFSLHSYSVGCVFDVCMHVV